MGAGKQGKGEEEKRGERKCKEAKVN